MTEEAKASQVKKAAKPAVKAQAKASVSEAVSGQREREGVVVSNKMQKTIIVQVVRVMEHPEYKRVIRRNVKYAVHDDKNEAKIGDKVRIIETRPLSKTKRWRLLEVVTKVAVLFILELFLILQITAEPKKLP